MDGIVLGFDELLLIYAETLASSGNAADRIEAISWLNKIETRAYGSAQTLAISTQDAIISAIQKERRLELALRGERLHELKRLNRL